MTVPMSHPYPDHSDTGRAGPTRSRASRSRLGGPGSGGPGAALWARWYTRQRVLDEQAQSTVEYALVLLGAAAVALALVAWVTRSDAVSRLFDAIVGRILSQAG